MNVAYKMQNLQDWFTQQWVITTGRKVDSKSMDWLMGPYGELNCIGENFILELADKENLIVHRNLKSTGLLPSFKALNISEDDFKKISVKVIDFYENTSDYELKFNVNWNPIFLVFGYLVNQLFSKRLNQLNIPLFNEKNQVLSSEIIQLKDRQTNKVKYTLWLRKVQNTGHVIYSGIYGTCTLANSTTCVKAVFPLPKGNATVVMTPRVGNKNELILDSSGKTFGDSGFYFLLKDSENKHWTKFIRSFKDKLIISEQNDKLVAKQKLKLWGIKVVTFNYIITKM